MKAFGKIIAISAALMCAVLPAACDGGDTTDKGGAKYAAHVDAEVSVVKKGVSVSRYNTGSDQNPSANSSTTLLESAERINDLNVGWYYNWGAAPNNPYVDESIEFVPMVWGRSQASSSATLADIKQKYDDGLYTHLLTFNEPDLPDQAYMTVDQALSYWPTLEALGMPLSSPAVSSYSSEKGHPWLDEFMAKADAQGRRVDFIAIHLYQSFYKSTAVGELKAVMTTLWNKYKRPIWLTEFAAVDIEARDAQQKKPGEKGKVNAGCTVKNAQNYMRQACIMLEQLGFVERYSWFVDNFAGLYDEYTDDNPSNDRPWEAPYTTLYDNDDYLSEVGTTYKGISSAVAMELDLSPLPAAKKGSKYSHTLSVRGGEGRYSFTATGLPGGLKLSGDGVISGTPTITGTFGVTVTVTDGGKSGRKQSLSYTFSLTIT
ncbi:MAG: putative Ig domain-containing protein [Clostridiales bacterium]|nr:putative Ig domain-containing protein [Clostridiales bacterium]